MVLYARRFLQGFLCFVMDSIVGDMILQKNKMMTHIVVDEIGMHIVDSCKVKKKVN